MKIFFSGSLKAQPKHEKIYKDIIKHSENNGHEVISLNNSTYADLLGKKYVQTHPQNEIHYGWIQKALLTCDCAIIECSKDGFTLGHIATLSVLYNKPVLCLSDHKDYSQFILNSKFYSYKYSNEKDALERVDKFFEEVKLKHLSIRKNIYITPDNANFLDWISQNTNSSASEVIRKLVDTYKSKYPEYPEII